MKSQSFTGNIPDTRFPVLLLFTVFFLLHMVSCNKDPVEYSPVPRSLEVWLHRVNTIEKAQHFQDLYSGFELDVHFDTNAGTFIVKHDFTDTTTLTLSTWLGAIADPDKLGYWLDFKNLTEEIRIPALTELTRIRSAFGLTGNLIIVESSCPSCLPPFDTLNFRISYYIPTFDPSAITPGEELEYRDYIEGFVSQNDIGTISGYYYQHGFMHKWFPGMNKLLWYLDSTDPAVKDSIVAETKKDPSVEVLLVTENYKQSDQDPRLREK